VNFEQLTSINPHRTRAVVSALCRMTEYGTHEGLPYVKIDMIHLQRACLQGTGGEWLAEILFGILVACPDSCRFMATTSDQARVSAVQSRNYRRMRISCLLGHALASTLMTDEAKHLTVRFQLAEDDKVLKITMVVSDRRRNDGNRLLLGGIYEVPSFDQVKVVDDKPSQ